MAQQLAHALLLEYARIPLQSEGSPASTSVDEFIAANYPKDLKEFLRKVLTAADKAAELDGVSARNKVWWPIVKAVVRATVKVVEAVNQRDKR
ncbi:MULTISPECIES: hypothetical protein [Myxococcus]|uniref:hypothetical protein n=1 Tax=Myxococcus TaxID=32 RepID=UPI0003174E82|nr:MULTISPECIES: hypothetical protein [Myxococcus]NOJ52310.1 ABC transporter ATP-binding protein [Myxococcus xanthus]QPM78814.1 ABC transporter ATP-binding protein [Myxococcus xanthus]QVW67885.1 ABC transporter ATP-binding protein [Myxococcus xanthus DZ2]QZZ54102.1 hypothetical protein MyxoNM_33240 [Myxococcus xanthus]UEO05994.1 ABC transporter ATP-binding protein [Myxococcus xanthus DZ2]